MKGQALAAAQAQKFFEVHYSILKENGTLERKVQVVPGKDQEDAIDTMKHDWSIEKIDLRKVNIYKIEEKTEPVAGAKAEKPKTESEKQPDEKKAEAPTVESQLPPGTVYPNGTDWNGSNLKPNSFNGRKMSFVCDAKQSVITNKDGVRTLKLVLEVSGTQVAGVQGGMLKYRPQESLKITCEPIQVDALDDKLKKPERQMTLDDATRTKKLEENKQHEAKQSKEKKPNGKAKPEDKPAAPVKVVVPGSALSQGIDSKGNEYFFDRGARQMYAATPDGIVSKVDGPPEPLKQRVSGDKRR